jgi:hypothetical protein
LVSDFIKNDQALAHKGGYLGVRRRNSSVHEEVGLSGAIKHGDGTPSTHRTLNLQE